MSDHDWRQTPTLDEFNAMYDEDDNIWWRIACGHHQNLYEAAVERYQTAEAAIQRVRELHYGYDAMDGLQRCGCCGHPWPCLTALALGGGDDG